MLKPIDTLFYNQAMRKWRRKYYDLFSTVYDRFVALHSSDKQGKLRFYLAEKANATQGDRVLDICTGTGSVLRRFAQRVRERGVVIGLDFSIGMLEVAKRKSSDLNNVYLLQAEASTLPFKESVFHVVTCSHAFYELKGETQDHCMEEVGRVLKPAGSFLIMEHDVPKNPAVRMLYYVRLISMGASKAIQILRHEKAYLRGYFETITSFKLPGGFSKIMICRKAPISDPPQA
jgi:ubiquinone/menaquinone biosynthesis C-methylase UbiE